ncbi:MAG TPA: Calx-beta domain-containing protein [Parafilimonas sp.]|nr:Calx-beta domain-containing protein [Parafilimonas sp.]
MKKMYTYGTLMLAALFCYYTSFSQCSTVAITGGACSGAGITATVSSIPASLEFKKDGITVQRNAPYWSQTGTTVAGGNGAGTGANQFNYSSSNIVIDADGNLYICDRLNYRVQKWAPGATEGVTVAGGNGSGSGNNQFGTSINIYVDAGKNIYIADLSNYRVQKWAPGVTEGVTVAGGNGQGSALNQVDPTAIGVDAAGNLYVVERSNARVTKWAPAATEGVVVAGGNGAGEAPNQLNFPTGIYVEPNGTLYIINRGNSSTVVKWLPGESTGTTILQADGYTYYSLMKDAAGYFYFIKQPSVNGNLTTQVFRFKEGDFIIARNIIATSYGSGDGQLIEANDACLDTHGNMYILDPGNFRVQKFSATAVDQSFFTTATGNYQAITTAFDGCVSSSNSIITAQSPVTVPSYVAICTGGSAALSVTNSGNFTWSPGGLTGSSITVSPLSTTVYTVTDNSSQCASIVIVDVNDIITGTISGPQCIGGNLTLNASKPPLKVDWTVNGSVVGTSYASYTNGNAVLAATGLVGPRGVCLDLQGNVYVAEEGNSRVTKWAPGATQGVVVAGGNGEGSNANQLFWAEGVFVDKNGNVYVADNRNARIQKFIPGSTTGITVAGGNGEGGSLSQLYSPQNVFVDDEENVYVAELNNARVTKWAPGATEGVIVAGGNGAGNAANQLNAPYDIVVDAAGNLYIADQGNNRVQKWAPGATSGITLASGSNNDYDLANYPSGIALDGAGNFYIINSNYGFISRWAPGATSGTYVAGTCCSGAGALRGGYAVRIDKDGNLYAASYLDGLVWKYPVNSTGLSFKSTVNSNYTAAITSFTGCTGTTDIFNLTPPPGDPAVFGNNTWNVYAWNSGGATINDDTWNTNYAGYYMDAALHFYSALKWPENSSPSDAPGYQGCVVNNDNFSWSAKRKGFPCDIYRIDVDKHDDAGQLFVNGVKVWEDGCCNPRYNIWKGPLGPESTVEFRVTEGGGESVGRLSFVSQLPVITPQGLTDVCFGKSVVLSSDLAEGNQWYKDGSPIDGATGQTYTATETGSYLTKITIPNCSAVASEPIAVMVATMSAPGDPSVFGDNTWNVYAYNSGNGTIAGTNWQDNYSGYYTDNSLSFNTQSKWFSYLSPSNADTYQGCPVSNDKHSWSAKRIGFPCGDYRISVPFHDDAVQLFINDVKVLESDNCCTDHGVVWQGRLDENSKIEFRGSENIQASYATLNIDIIRPLITTPATIICPGYAVPLTSNPGNAYLWSTGETTQSISVSEAGAYTVKVLDNCGNYIESPPVTITVRELAKPVIASWSSLNICDNGYGTADIWIENYNGAVDYIPSSEKMVRDRYSGDNFHTGYGGTYAITAMDALGCSAVSDSFTIITQAGNPDMFGTDTWNVYVFTNGSLWGKDVPWTHYIKDTVYGYGDINAYHGYYVESNLSFDTRDRWTGYPFYADGYSGCGYVNGAEYSWTAKRKGFACGNYKISIPAHKDSAQLWINGIMVWEHGGCCDSHDDVWQGVLGPDSRIEFRVDNQSPFNDQGEAGFGSIDLELINNTIAAPSITPPGPIGICTGSSVTLTSSAVSGNLWNTGDTARSINVTTAGDYSVTAIEGCTAQSNSVSVVAAPVTSWYADADHDGYGNPDISVQNCNQPADYVSDNKDCDDEDRTVHPGAPEICGNGIDDNCNGKVDEGCGNPIGITIADKSLVEKNRGQRTMGFAVKLSKKPAQTVQVDYHTQDGSATIADNDYIEKSGTLTFAPGIKRQRITIVINKDKTVEPDETFSVILSKPVNATITDGIATGTIINDDGVTIVSKTAIASAKDNVTGNSVVLAPNPANSRVDILLKGYTGIVTINVMSLEGKQLLQKKLQVTPSKYAQEPIDVSRFASGVYLVTIIDEHGNIKTEKLVVAH